MTQNELMIGRIVAGVFIFVCTCVAWMILGGTISARTENSKTKLDGKVESLWGGAHVQNAPRATFLEFKKVGDRLESQAVVDLPLMSTSVNVDLGLEHRQKGLLWYSTYGVNFQGAWSFQNTSGQEREIRFTFPLPAKDATYDALTFRLNGAAVDVSPKDGCFETVKTMPAGATFKFESSYRSMGLAHWEYQLGHGVNRARDFDLTVHTNFDGFDFPERTLAPAEKKQNNKSGWDLRWQYASLVSGFPIRVVMPEKLQPGPLAAEISYFAPVSLFFFFFLLWLGSTVRQIDIHPMHYFFLAAAFFAFHLLLAYLVDHLSIHLSFVICAAVSMGLVASYLRQVAGINEAWRYVVAAQLLYLVLFSYAFFFNGYTGLAVTVGAILTLFVSMQATAGVNWTERLKLLDLPRPDRLV